MQNMQLELTPVQAVIVLVALQDYARFSQDMMPSKVACDLFTAIDTKRHENEEFFKASLTAAELVLKPLVIRGQINGKQG